MTTTTRRSGDKTAAPAEPTKITIEDGTDQSNGTTQATGVVIQLPRGPRAPKRVRTVKIPEYEGFEMEIWVNYPQRLYDQMFGDDPKAADEASKQLFIKHNDWCDYEGVPYPPMDDPAFWQAIPNELAGVMIAVLRKESAELPNSLVRTRGR